MQLIIETDPVEQSLIAELLDPARDIADVLVDGIGQRSHASSIDLP